MHILTHDGAHEVVVGVYFEMVLQVGLTQKHAIAVFVRAAELFWVFVSLHVLAQFLLRRKCLVAPLQV